MTDKLEEIVKLVHGGNPLTTSREELINSIDWLVEVVKGLRGLIFLCQGCEPEDSCEKSCLDIQEAKEKGWLARS